MLSTSPILKLADLEADFILHTAASDHGIGAVLLQDEDSELFPVAYASRKLKGAEKAYAVIEKECLAVVWGIFEFESYLYGRKFIIETDHQPLVYLNKLKGTNARLMRWALLMQPNRVQIRAIRGKDNFIIRILIYPPSFDIYNLPCTLPVLETGLQGVNKCPVDRSPVCRFCVDIGSSQEGGPSPELDEHLQECPICLERFRQPKSLPCLHTFCQECLETFIVKELSGKMASATSFPCPVCRRMTQTVNQTEAKDKWAAQFPTNAVIQDLIKLKEHSSEPLYCKPCQTRGNLTNLAKFWCKSMNANFCETCKVQHHDIIHTDCDILDITGYDSRGTKQDRSAPKCDQHDEKLIWYCEDHKRLGCNICMIKDHRRCDEVRTAMEYLQKLKAGSQLEEMEMALKKGVQTMTSLVKDFDEQIQTMVQNQEIGLQSIKDLRQSVEEQLNKLQNDVTDKLITLFKEEKRNMEASLRHGERLMNSMLNTMKSSVTAAEENNTIEAIVLYQRGQVEVESCKALVTEMSTSFMSVTINHHIDPRLVTLSDEAMGKIVIERQRRRFPGDLDYLTVPLSERRVKEIGKFNVKTPSDEYPCWIVGVEYLPDEQIVLSDTNNKKLKLFTDKGQYLDELIMRGDPLDLCLVNNNTVAVAVNSPGGVRVVKVEDSKLSLTSEISMSNGETCYGITHRNGRFIVSTYGGEVYSVTQDGTTELLHKYNNTCYCLTQCPIKGDRLVSVSNNTKGDIAVSRLTADKRHTIVMKVGVVRGARGIDVDREGNIYVCGKDSHNVVQMSWDGTHFRELLMSSDGMKYPYAISVRGDTFVVHSWGSTDQDCYIRVFQLY
ncbi:tripartite motif-containing protein 2-like [Mizuhopecten yessoensis]|uniref:tripartite motif-containing protein 2-like n=1 Tax=Mizuhopecten yessoensis TaxID=6573 RepID=UPI000B45834C|nr:tripartite motif-containing protein 2-like [Mizuhopecten yessoensis]